MEKTHSISDFTLQDMAVCMRALRCLGANASSMEAVADRIVHYFYDKFENPKSGSKELCLIRFYKIHDYADLPLDLLDYTQEKYSTLDIKSDSKCLILLATAGQLSEWNSRRLSKGHQVLPLLNIEIVQSMPMVYQAISQLGLEPAQVTQSVNDFLVSEDKRSYNVFYVPEALGSPYIPAQDEFVIQFGIKSVLGFGGMLPSGNLFVVILFSKEPIPVQTAEIFKSLALSAKVAVVPFDKVAVFEPPARQ